MKQYQDTLRYILRHGVMRSDRTGKGRYGVFSPPDEVYDLSEGFPLATCRAIKTSAMIDELIWFISGSTHTDNLKYKFFWDRWTAKNADALEYLSKLKQINENDRSIFTANSRIGTIGNMYGVSWRNAPAPVGHFLPKRLPQFYPRKMVENFIPFDGQGLKIGTVDSFIEFLNTDLSANTSREKEYLIKLQAECLQTLHKEYWKTFDQLNELIYKIKTNPNSSRLRVTAYLTEYMAFEEFSPQENIMDGRSALTPCHTFFQCFVNPATSPSQLPRLDLKLTLTSSDAPVGRIYNIAQYALLTHLLAHCCDMKAGRLIISSGDTHIYSDQFEAVEKMLQNEPKRMPTLWLNPEKKDLFDFTENDIAICNYDPHPEIAVPVST